MTRVLVPGEQKFNTLCVHLWPTCSFDHFVASTDYLVLCNLCRYLKTSKGGNFDIRLRQIL